MRECWINVYPDTKDPRGGPGPYMPGPVSSVAIANENACGVTVPGPGELRAVGMGYRLHVRLKPVEMVATVSVPRSVADGWIDPAKSETKPGLLQSAIDRWDKQENALWAYFAGLS